MADADPPSTPQTAVKLLSTTSLKLRLALVAAGVLTVGALLSPPTVSQPLSVPQERAAPLIDEEVQRRDPTRLIPDVATLLREASNAAVAVARAARPAPRTTQDYARTQEESERPAGYGVVISTAGDVLSHVAAVRGQTIVQIRTPGGATVEARVMAYESSTGLVLLRAALGARATAPTVTAQEPQPGTPAVGIVVWPEQTLVHPVFVTGSHDRGFSIGGGAAGMLPGTPLYTAMGELFAITGAEPTVAYSVSEAVRRLTVQAASSPGLAPSLGISLQPLEGAVARAFGPTGALVSDVVDGGPASSAGLEPGDVLV
ncbi:MAG: hypothetical protein ACRD1H_19815, partial [Vicinamibacterales bacterium]